MSTTACGRTSFARALFLVCLMLIPVVSLAQGTGATVRGRVIVQGQPREGITVIATNTGSGYTSRAVSRANGGYVLVGLDPGSYQLRVTGQGVDQTIGTVRVQIGQTISYDLEAGATP